MDTQSIVSRALGIEFDSVSGTFQQEYELKQAIASRWKAAETEPFEMGAMLLELRDLLCLAGRSGEFKLWLKKHRIPQRAAFRLISFFEPNVASDN